MLSGTTGWSARFGNAEKVIHYNIMVGSFTFLFCASAVPMLIVLPFVQKSRHTFCTNRIEVKVLQRHRKCAPGVSKGAAFLAGARNSAPLGRLLLVLFLAKQEKYIPVPSETKKAKLFRKNNLTFLALGTKIEWSANADNSLLTARLWAIKTIRRCNQHG